jgi:hypothetical protein
VTMGSEAFRE